MSLSELITADLASQFNTDHFAETITYNGSSIPAIVDYTALPFAHYFNGSAAVIWVKKSDVSEPDYRDTVVIGGNTWKVYSEEGRGVVKEGDGYTWAILLYRGERLELL